MTIRLRRAFDPPAPDDGYRVLVDRLWPRGVARAALGLDAWARELAPSTELRKRFGHDKARWAEFRRRYHAELEAGPPGLDDLRQRVERGETVTLVYAARDTERNNALALRDWLEAHVTRDADTGGVRGC